jgi:hypothetical protein
VEVPPRTKTAMVTKRAVVTISFAETKLLVLNVLSREQKLNQNHFPAMIAPKLSNQNTSTKRRVGKNELIKHIDNSMCHRGARFKSILPGKR